MAVLRGEDARRKAAVSEGGAVGERRGRSGAGRAAPSGGIGAVGLPLRPRTATGDGCIARLGGVFNRLLYALISLRKRRDNILHDTVHFVGRVNWCGDPWLCP